MGDDLPDPIVLDDPDFLGLVVVLLFLVHKMERIRKWFTIDSNFKRPILNRTDRAPMRRPKSRCVTFCAFMSDPHYNKSIGRRTACKREKDFIRSMPFYRQTLYSSWLHEFGRTVLQPADLLSYFHARSPHVPKQIQRIEVFICFYLTSQSNEVFHQSYDTECLYAMRSLPVRQGSQEP